jgi:adenylyltransferase/sulfurtransferase
MRRRPKSEDQDKAQLPSLTSEERQRYARHLILPEVGEAGQRKLKAARVLCIGLGGLGSPVALYLAAAGVGTLGLVDGDRVERTNLQRQVLHATPDVGSLKMDSARRKLETLNPAVKIEAHPIMLRASNALELIAAYDVVVDGTDNFATRYLVNDACVLAGKPNVYGSIFRFEGQASVFAHEQGPCYRCLYPEPPPPGMIPDCAEGGVLGVLPGLIGTIQATEAIKLILGLDGTLTGRLLIVDALAMQFHTLALRRNPDCPVCGDTPTIHTPIEYRELCGWMSHSPDEKEMQVKNGIPQITVHELKRRREAGEPHLLLDVREPWEYAVAHIGGHLIPQGEVAARLDELDREVEIVVHCHGGVRSQRIAELLRQNGFERVSNLAGGIHAWSVEIDPKVPTY